MNQDDVADDNLKLNEIRNSERPLNVHRNEEDDVQETPLNKDGFF